MRRTPLLDLHKELGASIGEFGGVTTAISFGSVIEEHMSVRTEAGVFDLSHMSLISVKNDADSLLEKISTRQFSSEEPLRMIGPSLFLNERGGIKDDVMVYKLGDGNYIVVGNAMNHDKDLAWLEYHVSTLGLSTSIEDANEELALLALQGPKAKDILSRFDTEVTQLRPLEFRLNVNLDGVNVRILSRSGWTGEDGFEFILEHGEAELLFKKLIEMGAKPCGLAARDSLRLEMGYYLYGHEIGESINPIEARYWMGIDFDKLSKGSCVGCDVVYNVYRKGVDKVLIGLRFSKKERTIPRQGSLIYVDDEPVGHVTSGGFSPVLKRPVALAFVDARHALMGMRVHVKVRNKLLKTKIVDYPFINK